MAQKTTRHLARGLFGQTRITRCSLEGIKRQREEGARTLNILFLRALEEIAQPEEEESVIHKKRKYIFCTKEKILVFCTYWQTEHNDKIMKGDIYRLVGQITENNGELWLQAFSIRHRTENKFVSS